MVANPDLGASLAVVGDSLKLGLYVVHQKRTFRIFITIDNGTISNLKWTNGIGEAAAISFDVASNKSEYAAWKLGNAFEQDAWSDIGDFTGGEASQGGKCELTGTIDVSINVTGSKAVFDRY